MPDASSSGLWLGFPRSASSHCCVNDDDDATVVWEPHFCNGSQGLSTGPKEAEGGGGHRAGVEVGGGGGGGQGRPGEGVVEEENGSEGAISELMENFQNLSTSFHFHLYHFISNRGALVSSVI